MREKSGTFVVTHGDDDSAIVRDVETAQVHTLASNPGLEPGEVIEATIAPDPPLDVSWQVVDVDSRRTVEVFESELEPTARTKELGADLPTGAVTSVERAGSGEIHVLSVPADAVGAAATDVLADVETVARAARLGAVRVEVRMATDEGVLSVRYLPD